MDEAEFAEFVNANCQGMTAEPQNAVITRVDGKFEITPEVDGKTVDTEATRAALETALAEADAEAVTVEAAITVKEAAVREEQLATIQDELGSFSTDFSSSGDSRSGNLQNGAAKINGHVLMPGETLSGYECMHPFTKENGYFSAAAYENGRVVDSIGGGVCQISTTLYQGSSPRRAGDCSETEPFHDCRLCKAIYGCGYSRNGKGSEGDEQLQHTDLC